MGGGETKTRMPPDVLQTVLLDEIRREIVENKKVMQEQIKLMQEAVPEGLIEPLTINVTDILQEWHCSPMWFGFTIFNDGPNNVYFDVNRDQNARLTRTPLGVGEHMDVHYAKTRVQTIYLRCLTGELANVRIFATR